MASHFSMKKLLKEVRHIVEATVMLLLLLFFRALPLDWASALGSSITSAVGPLLKAHRTAKRNLERVFPTMPEAERKKLLRGMWDNLGRTAGEFAFMSTPQMLKRVTIEGGEHMEYARINRTGCILVGGHFSNWELLPVICAHYKLPLQIIIRQSNNPYARKVLALFRTRNIIFLDKSRENLRKMYSWLRDKNWVGMLADQKLNEGPLVEFMGHPARTATSPARMAMHFKVPIITMQAVRTHGARFQVTISPPRYIPADATEEQVMRELHEQFEQWIREHPEQWFWVHNRWSWPKTREA